MSLGALDPAVSFRRDDGFGAGLGDLVDKMVGIIALSAIVTSAVRPSIRSCAKAMSLRCPGVPIKRIGLPRPSPAAWILVLRPHRDRPRPWASAPLLPCGRQRRVDAPAQWLSRSSAIPDRLRGPVP